MSDYNLSQTLNHLNENNYDDSITATVAEGKFIAVTNIALDEGGDERTITVQIMSLEQSPGGTLTINSGLFVKQPHEQTVKAVLMDEAGNEVANNSVNYPS